jgi:Fe-S-cluster containining protein
MDEIRNFKEKILQEHPRLNPDHVFRFECHSGLSCFNECCGDVNIFLTPYDIIRLKNKLGISSGEFLERYTMTPFNKRSQFPVVILRMGDDDKKKCLFNAPEGCTVYSDRPWACRMFPLGMASPGESNKEVEEEFYFLLKETHCKGFECAREQTIAEYKTGQGVEDYNENSEGFKYLTTHPFFSENKMLPPEKMDMFYTVCYDIDSFRRFVFNSTFLDKFEIDPEAVERMREDDVELLKLGFDWLRFSLFGESTMTIMPDIVETKKQELAEKPPGPAS